MEQMIRRPKLCLTRDIPKPTYYVKALEGEYRDFAYNEERAFRLKGRWREGAFSSPESVLMDLEIGTGNGFHFAHQAIACPERKLLGIELKYKPLIQAIRRALKGGATNARMLRYNARFLQDIFSPGELDNVYIHFPDPWSRLRQNKHRLVNSEFLYELHRLQKPGSIVEFKTDNRDYFDVAYESIKKSDFEVIGQSYDLHKSEFAAQNFSTHFEKIFLAQQIPINFALLRRNYTQTGSV